MKKILLGLAVIGITASVFAQGTINFSSLVAPGNSRGTNQTLSTGGTGTGLASGASFLAQLYVGAAGVSDPTLLSTNSGAGPAIFNTGGQAGYFAGGPRTLAGVALGATVTVQIRAWSSAFPSWEAAPITERTALSGAFAPNLIQIVTGGGGTPAGPPAALTGLTPYVIGVTIPEPSSIALGLLGLGAIALFRRRK